MANRSSFMLALLLIANPFMLLFFQNCSVLPQFEKTPVHTAKQVQNDHHSKKVPN